jgi:hypothetical protein
MTNRLRTKTKTTRFVAALIPAIILGSGSVFACDHGKESKTTAEEAQHQGHETHAAAPEVATKRWPTNKHLRKSMESIETAFAEATRGQAPNRASARKLGSTVESAIADIVKHCSLPKDADAALHPIINAMTSAATQLKVGRSIEPALTQLSQALDTYRATFDHPAEKTAHAH